MPSEETASVPFIASFYCGIEFDPFQTLFTFELQGAKYLAHKSPSAKVTGLNRLLVKVYVRTSCVACDDS